MRWARASEFRVRPLTGRDRAGAEALLRPSAREDLVLLDAVTGAGPDRLLRTEVVGAFAGDRLIALAMVRPGVALASANPPGAAEFFVPFVLGLGGGLIKSPEAGAGELFEALRRRGVRALLDRRENALALEAGAGSPRSDPRVRPAGEGDLPRLVEAARASLREEGRPDPFDVDPAGFRRWVRGRIPRARVLEEAGEVAFVGYADVQRPEGWLVQGVFTWPRWRRRGLAEAGMRALLAEAFAAGADHVQLAVVEGNTAAERLYAKLGFRRFGTLRTILFR